MRQKENLQTGERLPTWIKTRKRLELHACASVLWTVSHLPADHISWNQVLLHVKRRRIKWKETEGEWAGGAIDRLGAVSICCWTLSQSQSIAAGSSLLRLWGREQRNAGFLVLISHSFSFLFQPPAELFFFFNSTLCLFYFVPGFHMFHFLPFSSSLTGFFSFFPAADLLAFSLYI